MYYMRYNSNSNTIIVSKFVRRPDTAAAECSRRSASRQSHLGTLAPVGVLVPVDVSRQDRHSVGAAARLEHPTHPMLHDNFFILLTFIVLTAHPVFISSCINVNCSYLLFMWITLLMLYATLHHPNFNIMYMTQYFSGITKGLMYYFLTITFTDSKKSFLWVFIEQKHR